MWVVYFFGKKPAPDEECLAPLMASERSSEVTFRSVQVLFPLEANAWHGSATERLWAEEVEKGQFRLQNSPFYAFGVSFEDIVSATEVDGQLTYQRVLHRGGHSTYRLRLKANGIDSPAFSRAWSQLQAIGCTYEEGPVLAVDIPSSTNADAAYALLQSGEAAGLWAFEEGHCGHP
jgi:hypothetical protein